MSTVLAHAPGRVNLIGEHTDYTGGFVLPMAIDRGTTIHAQRHGERVALSSADEVEPALVPLDVDDPMVVTPPWARYVAGVVAEVRPAAGLVGEVRTTLPIGAGLSSSAALEVAVALAIGSELRGPELALLCRRAEQAASGVPCGVMDQMAVACAQPGHALLLDCRSLEIVPVPIPDDVEIVVVPSGESRRLATSAYGERRRECNDAEAMIGPLRDATPDAGEVITDDTLRRRARHVIGENHRVLAFADALRSGDLVGAGALMASSHASLRDDFEVSTPTLDALVERLRAVDGVFGVRLTGAGFGGCVVALCRPGALAEGWAVQPAGPPTVELV